MGSIHSPPHDSPRLEILKRGVGLAIAKLAGAAAADALGGIARAPQGLRSAVTAARCKWDVAVEPAVEGGGGWRRGAAELFAAIAEDVIVLLLVVEGVVVNLALAAGGAEVALLAFAATADTRRIVWVVDGAEVAAHLAAAAGDAGLVDALVLGLLGLLGGLRRRRAGRRTGSGSGSTAPRGGRRRMGGAPGG